MFFRWDQDALDAILSTQRAVIKHQKAEKVSKLLYSIAVVVDDFADSPSVMSSRAGGSQFNTLLVRGRHMMISTFVLTQKLNPAKQTRTHSLALIHQPAITRK